MRLRAAAIVFRDRRWLPWAAYFKMCPRDTHRDFDATVLAAIAELPLNSELRFEPDHFFDAMLARIRPAGHG